MVTLATGWGRSTYSAATLVACRDLAAIVDAVRSAPERGLLARGLGRSYGDSALNAGGTLIDLGGLDGIEVLDDRVRVGAGVRLQDLIAALLPTGHFVPVTPGTSQVTVGGLLAADVHGKNHHRDGTFGSHVEELTLVDGRGEVRRLSPADGSAPEFWATVGGMGLTGIVTEAVLRVPRVETAWMTVDTIPCRDLDELLVTLAAADASAHYSVAWIDSAGPRRGRGIVSLGEHARAADLPPPLRTDPLRVRGRSGPLRVPGWVPGGLLNARSIRAFNAAWFRLAGRSARGQLQSPRAFFHPLDGIADWNRLYGRPGMVQYQVVVPDDRAGIVAEILDTLSGIGSASFLSVLKRFGPANPAPLSFPRPGWTLAVDLPATGDGLARVLDRLDAQVLDAGGRFYLAKDARMSPAAFRRSYPRLNEWRSVRDALDPEHRFMSDQARRLLVETGEGFD